MIALAWYILKVIICSGVLLLYYHLALRNKLFHQWNRFYLLAAVVISVTAPLLKFSFESSDDNAALILLNTTQAADNYVIAIQRSNSFSLSTEQWFSIGYLLVSSFLFIAFITSLLKIATIISRHPVQVVEKIKFLETDVNGTPFSFFQYIFWNRQIDLHSQTGQQIFQHELVHVKEKHTLDKIFMQIILILFWANPIFWFIRKELRLIHEFIADKKAVKQYGAAAFASIILQSAFPQHYSSITNQFFQSTIKRRLVMLTKIKNPKWNYFSRVMVLPVLAILILAFSFRTKEKFPGETINRVSLQNLNPDNDTIAVYDAKGRIVKYVIQPENHVNDTLPKKISEINVNSNTQKVSIVYSDGKRETISVSEAVKRELINYDANSKELRSANIYKNDAPFYIVNGKLFIKDINMLDPNEIKSINVLKGDAATKKYGKKAEKGVIEITTKDIIQFFADSLVISFDETFSATLDSFSYSNEKGIIVDEKNIVFEKSEEPATVDKKEWTRFLESNLQKIIEDAVKRKMPEGQYTVLARFIVEIDGSLSDISTLTKHGYGLEDGIIKIMKASPSWNSAKQNGKSLRSYHTQPITFVILGE